MILVILSDATKLQDIYSRLHEGLLQRNYDVQLSSGPTDVIRAQSVWFSTSLPLYLSYNSAISIKGFPKGYGSLGWSL